MTNNPILLAAISAKRRRRLFGARYAHPLLCSLSLAFSAVPTLAEELSHDQMVCALNPQCGMPFVDRQVSGITATTQVVQPLASVTASRRRLRR